MFDIKRTEAVLTFYDSYEQEHHSLPLNLSFAVDKAVFYHKRCDNKGCIEGRFGEFVMNSEHVKVKGGFDVLAKFFIQNFLKLSDNLLTNSVLVYATIFKNNIIQFIDNNFAEAETHAPDDALLEDPLTSTNGYPHSDLIRSLEYALLDRDGWIDARRLGIMQKYFPDFKLIQLSNTTDSQAEAPNNRISMLVFVWSGIKFRYDRGLTKSCLKAAPSRAQKP